MGATVKCMLPSREGDGYGLSKNAIQSMHNKGCTLIVTVDNGISAVEEADFAASLGMDLIITDHHLPPETLPKAVAVVDPRREDDHSPFKGLCGAGVAFKLCAALEGCDPAELLEMYGELAALGTVADVMPLVGQIQAAAMHILCFNSTSTFQPTCSSQKATASFSQPSASVPLPAATAWGASSYTW